MVDATFIYNLLKADAALKSLLGATSSDTKIYPYSTDITGGAIVYILSPVSDEDALRTDKLEIRVISNDLGKAHTIDNRVRAIMKTIGDTSNGNMLKVLINGGGSLEDLKTETYHILTYYYITQKGV